MAEIVRMTQLSPTMEEGLLVQWLRKEGDTVETGDLIAEVETDKATMEMESYFDGTILKILVEEGSAVEIGKPMAVIGEPGESWEHLLDEGGDGAEGAAPAAAPTSDDPANAEAKPTSGEDSTEEGSGKQASDAVEATDEEPAAASEDASAEARRVRSSPLARRKAEDLGVDLRALKGSGPSGRVIARDVDEAAESREARPVEAEAEASAEAPRPAAPTPAASPEGESHTVALSPMRRAIARNLTEAWSAPAFMLTREIDAGPLMAARARWNDELREAGLDLKLSVNDLIIKAAAWALVKVPQMNSAFEGKELRLFHHAHIGIAVAVEGGLVTPVIRFAERRSLGAIATEARTLAGKARDKKLKPEEYEGATFLISNLGMYGIDHFTAVLNGVAAGILAVGSVTKKPVVDAAGELAVGTRMNVTLTCDHRAVDGAVGAEFLQKLVVALERPVILAVAGG